MRCYLFKDSHITVLHDAPQQADADGDLISRVAELDPKHFPLVRLVAIHNRLPGIEAVKRFADRKVALKRIWAELEKLPLGDVRPESKQARVERLLRHSAGADMTQLIAATGWQPHSIRGVLSGVLHKKHGLMIASAVEGERRVYRITA